MGRDDRASATGTPRLNGLSVDVEDYFHAEALASVRGDIGSARLPERFEMVTGRLLDLFARHEVKATFYTLGWVAERSPALIKRIVTEGHELGCHSYSHKRICDQTKEEFRRDLVAAKQVLEEAGETSVLGYRAPTFSISEETLWAYEILDEEGFTYSSSVYPVRHDLYGMPGAPRQAHRPLAGSDLIEIPMSTIMKGGQAIQGGGGGYFRLLPYFLSAKIIRQVNREDEQPFTFYMHPWEIDPGQPRISSLPLKSRLRHYSRLGATEAKLVRLLGDFRWGRMDEAFGHLLADPGQVPRHEHEMETV